MQWVPGPVPGMSNTFKNFKKMKHFELNGQVREVGNKAVIKATRKQGLVPCNLYGLGMENVLFTVDAKELDALICNPAAFIVDLTLDNGQKYMAVLHELQFHPVKDNCLHVDFLAVDEVKPIVMNVPLTISGHSVGVQKGGKFYQNERTLRICATMANLPDSLNIDITDVDLDKKVKAGSLSYENITVLTDKNVIVCGVKATRNSKA